MKRILVLFLALCLICATTVTAFAAENTCSSDEVDYLNYAFPEDAVVLYQSEDGVIYQSNQKSEEIALASDMTFNYVDFGPGHWTGSKNFNIDNPHTMPFTTTYGTFKVESDYDNAEVHMILSNGMSGPYADLYVKKSEGDVHFEFQSITKTLTVQCFPSKTSNVYGIRALCWLY